MSTAATSEKVDEILDHLTREGEAWRAQVAGDTIEVALTEVRRCQGCGQHVEVSGPVAWLTRSGHDQGGWSQQHGCGAWNEPLHALRYHTLDADLDVEDLVSDMVDGIRRARDHRDEADDSETRARCLQAIEQVRHAIDHDGRDMTDPDDAEDVELEAEVRWGDPADHVPEGADVWVWFEGGGLVAWHPDLDDDIILEHEAD